MEKGGVAPEFVFGDFHAPPPPPPENPFRPSQPHHPECPLSTLDKVGGATPEIVFRGVTPEVVFRDFRARQKGILKAFTTEVDRFYLKCDTEEVLCLYGFPDETWEVHLPVKEAPPDLPEPALGINFARDARDDKCWLSRVAAYSDSWLLSVAFYYAAMFDFDQESRKRLFSMINSVPTIFEVVTGTDKKQPLPDPPYPAPSHRPMDNCRRSPEFVFRNFRGRQQGLLKAVTTELDRFYLMCDQEKEARCLYGRPNETWKLGIPTKIPPSLPEPTIGINVAPDVNDKNWLSLGAAHSDSWLLSVAFYYAASFGFNQKSRERLFSKINSVPTIFEVVMGTASKTQPARQLEPNPKSLPVDHPRSLREDKEASDSKEEEKVEKDHQSTLCCACGETRRVFDLLQLV